MSNTLKFGNGQWATKEGSTLAYNDENNNFKPLPFNFERGSSATVVNKDGLIETVGSDMPRIDYKDDSEGTLLLEPQRTNIWTNSNLSTSISLDGLTRTLNQSVSPSGDSDATLFNETATTGTHRFYRLDIPSTSTDFSISFFAKKNGINIIRIVALGGAKYADFDLSLGTVGNESGINSSAIEDYGNGWYRCVINVTAAGWVGLYALNDSSQNSYLGNVSKGVYLYGAQLELGSYASSYIPTEGSAVTRLADVCNNGGNEQVINSTEGVLYAEIAALVNDNDGSKSLSLSSGNYLDNIIIQYTTSTNQIVFKTSPSYSTPIFQSFTVSDITQYSKIAFSFKNNNCSFWHNGVKLGSVSSFTPFSSGTLSVLNFNRGDGGEDFEGKPKDVRVYNTALTDLDNYNN